MKFNTTYTSKLSLKDTILLTNEVRQKILSFFDNKFSVINLLAPISLNEGNALLSNDELETRSITFDSTNSFETSELVLSNTNYLRDIMYRIDWKKNECIFSESSFVWRDAIETPNSTSSRFEMYFVFCTDNPREVVKQIIIELYSMIFSIASDIETKFSIDNIYPKTIETINPSYLEIEKPYIDSNQKEVEYVITRNAFILESMGSKTMTGHIHRYVSPLLYNLQNYEAIILKDRVNIDVVRPIIVSELAMGKVLESQLNSYGFGDFKQNILYTPLINSDKKIIEVKINLPLLMLSLLGKGHISEVQPGNASNEVKIISSKYKVEIY